MNNTFGNIDTPIYIIEEERLRRNLELIADVARRADVEIILAFKAFALWKTFHIFREYIGSTTASSLCEARLAAEEFGAPAHTYSPAYTDSEIDDIARCSSHITFNSLAQLERFGRRVRDVNPNVSCGLRVNPEYSEVGTLLYNPCAPGTRFGITADRLPDVLPDGVEGFHCHCHCESGADVFQRTLVHIEEKFGRWMPQLKWMNFGGGHLMTRCDYDVDLLVELLTGLHRRYPDLKIILEPGSAFAWQTGPLVAQVVDVVEDRGIKTAILDVSFTCHMPDCLEMPYQPEVRGTEQRPMEAAAEDCTYRLGGNSCLSGDFMGAWRFDVPLKPGDRVVFEDMIHYTTVKTNMFNGITHPAIGILRLDGEVEILRRFGYDDYKKRMD
ncbi:carboxynorspermidine decarboxylase [Xylanibacter rodentium]|jgi:carboxynorspermidine decarboxylase|uniref:Carboxynorspermidine/carboxyspermidine decarboxylase n=1 Tax=Xylanibacter rodentium TaxID=2736289 RepID=A0ABX2ATA3_9BACT|nr:carboxynorspermidine decarboxylase [Xylanibacter rodentium]NPE10843.1 carboxynorspermidine decarboxylase [Prevotella sp. PJ1A]NPE13870.1 carboxynorspermidine decarboxylase [Xylanibacter rodentium]NPE37794.1 carboxynorspermidine decarboxylase [Prevotella sp. PCJ2]